MPSCNQNAGTEIIGDSERRLICAVFLQALRDLRSDKQHLDALSWLRSSQARAWLQVLDISPEQLDQVILSVKRGADLRVRPGAPVSKISDT